VDSFLSFQCLISYATFEIQQGADEIACPDASCEKQGELCILEVEQLVPPMLLEKHKKFKHFRGTLNQKFRQSCHDIPFGMQTGLNLKGS